MLYICHFFLLRILLAVHGNLVKSEGLFISLHPLLLWRLPAGSNNITRPLSFPFRVLLSFNLRSELDVALGKPTEFAEVQKDPVTYYGCFRPPDREPKLPLTLLDPVFARFVDD